MCESDEIGCGIGYVGKVKESCVEPSSGNRDAAPPKGDTADECLQNNNLCFTASSKAWGL